MKWSDIVTKARSVITDKQLCDTYLDRLEFELAETEKQGAESKWISWVTAFEERGAKFPSNPNGLVLPWLIGMYDHDPLASRKAPLLNTVRAATVAQYKRENGFVPPDFIKDSDMPDIDIDCLPSARDKLKEYAIRKYGSNFNDEYGSVCSVGTWQTYKFRSAIIDTAVAMGAMDRYEAESYTTILPEDVDELQEGGMSGCKGTIYDPTTKETKECKKKHAQVTCPKCGSPDTEGPTIGKLLAEHVQLQVLYSKHPDVVDNAVELVGRIRNMGMHAGALIITDRPLYGNIPLAKSGKKGFWASMWTEGRNAQLSKFGYVKWDLLGLKTLEYITTACRLIEENRGISFDNMRGWDDIDPANNRLGYFYDANSTRHDIPLDNEGCFELINNGQLVDSIFQLDTDLAKSTMMNGVSSFNDLTMLIALGHPGPMQSIPEIVANRDDPKQAWRKKIDPMILPLLESTYGHICFHEDTLVSLSDGSQVAIKNVKPGMVVCSENLTTHTIEHKVVEACGPTQFTTGLKITLDNGYSITVTDNHKLCLWDNIEKPANRLQIGDLVSVPRTLRHVHPIKSPDIAGWLGTNTNVAYLLGQCVGDLTATSTGSSLCVGSEQDCDIILKWLSRFEALDCRKYFHCRCWYIQISSTGKTEVVDPELPLYSDCEEWYTAAYEKTSGSQMAIISGKSTWLIYNRLRKFGLLQKRPMINPRSSLWQDFLRTHNLKTSLWHKRIPPTIFTASKEIQGAFIAGLLDSDGSISVSEFGYDIINYASASQMLLTDLCHLLQLLGIAHVRYLKKVFVWDTEKLRALVEKHLLIKSFRGTKHTTGDNLGWVPSSALLIDGLSKRDAIKLKMHVKCRALNKRQHVRSSTAQAYGIDLGDIRYHKIKKIERTEPSQYYNLSVQDNHTVVMNGISSRQCYQEQLQAMWQVLAGFTSPESQEARKAVAKKWVHKLKGIERKWLDGATPNIGREAAEWWWMKMTTFGRYAFNLSHAVAYTLVTMRCLFLKRYFAPEWWAAVMSGCHPDKLVRYMGVARSERWNPVKDITYSGTYKGDGTTKSVRFDTINIQNLTVDFTVTGDVVNQGLIGIKGIGDNAALMFSGKGTYKDIDDFVLGVGHENYDELVKAYHDKKRLQAKAKGKEYIEKPFSRKSKTVLERFIKLGAFKNLPGHENAKALWLYYQYAHCNNSKLKNEVRTKLLAAEGWTPESIELERERQIDEYRLAYPKRNKIPKKIEEWNPKPVDTRQAVMTLVKDDFALEEKLEFQKAYLGYYIDSPLDIYKCKGGCTIADVKTSATTTDTARVEAIVVDFTIAQTKKEKDYGRLIITDGVQTALVMLWDLRGLDPNCLVANVGVTMFVNYDETRGNFTLGRGEAIYRLKPKAK